MTTSTALVTGASSGIGAAFAKALGHEGHDLVLVARRGDRLEALKGEIQERSSVRVEVLATDLSDPTQRESIPIRLSEWGLHVDLLVNSAGFGRYEEFSQGAWAEDEKILQLNVLAITSLCKAVLPGMVERRSGSIINVASLAAFNAVPYGAIYAASKAYVLSFSEALAAEAAPYGVKVLCLCPGSTESEIHGHSGVDPTLVARTPMQSADEVARRGLAALRRSEGLLITDPLGAFGMLLSRFVPRELPIKVAGAMFKPQELRERMPERGVEALVSFLVRQGRR